MPCHLILGIHENAHMDALHKMSDLVNNMYFKNSRGKLVKKPFQTGILVSIKSTIDLYYELKSEGTSYLLTSRINQDALENTFSQIRAIGNNSHPSTVETINRIRKLSLTRNVKNIVTNASRESNDEDNFLTAELVNDLNIDLDDDLCDPNIDLVDEFHEEQIENDQPRDYVAGHICKKLKLLQLQK